MLEELAVRSAARDEEGEGSHDGDEGDGAYNNSGNGAARKGGTVAIGAGCWL